MQPTRDLPREFVTDAVIWSLFAPSNQTVSLREVEYEGNGVTFYGDADATDNKLTFGSNSGDSVNFWLTGQEGKYWNVTKLDASGYTGDAELVGSGGANNEITGGAGHNTLWGGIGNDTLIGGTGSNTYFYFAAFDGEDEIQGARNGDVVQVVGSLEDIDYTDFDANNTPSGINLKMNNGGSLKITAADGQDLTQVTVNIGSNSFRVKNGGGFESV